MDFLQAAMEAARLGGQKLEEWGEKFTAREKSPANLVTEADLASQTAIFEFLRGHYPDHRFLGEEGLLHNEGDSPYRWIIDPLDGTSNYVHRFPYYAVSIGLEKAGEMIAGVIYDPNRDEMFAATAGGGATLNGSPIQVSENAQLNQAMCMASLPVKVNQDHPSVKRFLRILELAQTVQRTGSAALNLCAVASGRIEAFWSTSLQPWDMAAGVLIVQEAGGRITTTSDEVPFSVMVPDVLATNGLALHQSLVEVFRSTPSSGS
ncbi:inositol monophosphatase family protein [Planctomicrobium sp. SH661]|uniref:inositol monophosphatase family protein n=1 Tax=Planctomicrobium sp. SH661 TaxID=3448124 RepID=UPI003F5B06EF